MWSSANENGAGEKGYVYILFKQSKKCEKVVKGKTDVGHYIMLAITFAVLLTLMFCVMLSVCEAQCKLIAKSHVSNYASHVVN